MATPTGAGSGQLTLMQGGSKPPKGSTPARGSSWAGGGGSGGASSGSGSGGSGSGSGSSWTTQVAKTPNYSPNDFYVGASDVHGHGEKWTSKIPTDVAALVMLIVHSEDFPDYNSPQDYVRDSCVHRAHYLMDQLTDPAYREAVASSLARILAAEKLDAAKREVEWWTEWVTKFETTMVALQKVGNWERVWHHLQDIDWSVAEGITEPYKTMVREHIDAWTERVPAEIREA